MKSIEPSKTPAKRALRRLTANLEETLALIEDKTGFSGNEGLSHSVSDQPPSAVLDQCLALCAEWEGKFIEPVRSIHHLACTGGTLITKCLAAMPNTQILSEVDPLSKLPIKGEKPFFAPTDMIRQLRQATRGGTDQQIVEMFVSNLEVIYNQCSSLGQRLVLRDHAHSHFCVGATIPDRLALRDIILSRFRLLSIVTVRHPVDSFVSLKRNGWIQFSPGSFDEYCRRYLAFIEAHSGTPIIKYENFVEYPHEVMNSMCEHLDIPVFNGFRNAYGLFKMTGDSGRASSVIARRSRRSIDNSLKKEIGDSAAYRRLLAKLEYSDVLDY